MIKTKNKEAAFLYRLFQFIAILIIFDGVRSNTIGGSFITALRDLSVLFLLWYTVFIKKFSAQKVFSSTILLFIAYHTIISIFTILFQPSYTPALILKPYFLIICIYIFQYFEEITKRTYQEYIKFIITVSIVFVFFNTVFYFVPAPFLIEQKLWWGRISIAYPTMDVVTLSYVLILLMYYPNIKISSIKRIIYMFIIISGIFFQFSGTGIILFGGIFISFVYYLIFSSNKILKKEILILISIIIMMSGSIISYVKLQFTEEYETGIALIENKISILSGDIGDNDFNTMDIRQQAIDNTKKKYVNNSFSKVFGIGLGKATNDLSKLSKDKSLFMLEDQYSLINICYGYIGLFLFSIIIISFVLKSVKSKLPTNLKIMFLNAGFIFAANCKTLTSLYLFPNYVFIALFFILIKKEIYAYHNRLPYVG